MDIFPSNWASVFTVETALFELIARGTALYVGVLILVRMMPRRTGGELATMDLIFVLLIAEAAAHALGDYSSVGDGMVMIVTLMSWNWLVNVLSFRIPALERLASAPPIQVIREGKLLRRNMRREYLTESELMSHLRQEGISEIQGVKAAFVESDGRVSVLKNE